MEYSREQLNYFRLCYVGFNLVPVGLRQIFITEWDFLHKTGRLGEWKDTPKNGLDFYNNESRRSHTRNARYLATVKNGNTAEWDCTCLFFAILYSDSIGTTLSPAVNTAVDGIRQVRNAIAHISEAKLTNADLQTYVGRVINAFTSLGLPINLINDIEDIKNQTTFPTKEVENLKKQVLNLQNELDQAKCDLEETKNTLKSTKADLVSSKEENKTLTQEISFKLEPFCFLTTKPPHVIIKRSDEVERITDKMQELYNGANGAVSTIYLSGNPGCGKSQLARQIGHDFFFKPKDRNKDLIFAATLDAESIETLADSYIIFAKHVGVTEYTLTSLESSKSEKPRETIQQLQRLISPKVIKFSKWMIIADNVIDLRLVRDFLPQTGSEEWGPGQVLITTQDSATIPHNTPHTYHESFSKGMQPDDAMELLETVSQISVQEQGENVARFLDCQPLALAAAAYYVQTVVKSGSPNYSWSEYLEKLTQTQQNVTENLLASESSAYPKTTTTAVKMATQRVVETEEVLRQTFSFFAICANEFLPLEAVMKFVKARITDQPEELIKAKIVRSSLILVDAEEGVEQIYLRLHNIVHTVLKKGGIFHLETRENDQNMAEALKIFKHLLKLNDNNYTQLKRITCHCRSLLEHITSHFTFPERISLENLTRFIDLDEVIGWLGSLASICHNLSDFKFAKYVIDLACSLLKKMDDTVSSATNITEAWIFCISGSIYDTIGEFMQAKELHEKALAIRKKIFGEEHADVALSYSNLATVYKSIGEYSQAQKLHEKALAIRKKIFGQEHADVASSYNNLANVYDSIGEYNQAKELHEKALAIKKKNFGEEHADVATSYNNLATVYDSIGEYNQAKELYEKALAIRKKIFGQEHADVASSYNNLANVYKRIGEYSQAKELHEKALAIRKKIFGEEHADVASSYNNLATVYNSIGEYNQAKELYEKALAITKKIFGEEHADVASSYNNLATVYDSIGEYNQAKELHEKALAIKIKIFGQEHADVASSYNNLANVYVSIGEYNQAKELHEKALAIRKKIFGEEHADVATSYNNLATVYDSIGEYNQAKELYEKALAIRKKIFGEEHADVASSYNNLAIVDNLVAVNARIAEITQSSQRTRVGFTNDNETARSCYCVLW